MKKNTDIPTAKLIIKPKLEAAIKFIPYFETKDKENHKIENKSLLDPHISSEKISKFISLLDENNFLVPYNWQEWISEAEKPYNNAKSFEVLDLGTISKLFILYIRAYRFMTGYLGAVIEKGYVLKVLRRIKSIKSINRNT